MDILCKPLPITVNTPVLSLKQKSFTWSARASQRRVWIVECTPVLPLLHKVSPDSEQFLPHLFQAVPAKRTFVLTHLCTYTDPYFNTS